MFQDEGYVPLPWRGWRETAVSPGVYSQRFLGEIMDKVRCLPAPCSGATMEEILGCLLDAMHSGRAHACLESGGTLHMTFRYERE